MKSTSHSETPMFDQQRPLRDRLLEFRGRCLFACAEENIKSTELPDMFLEAVDELDRLSKHREATGCYNTDDLNEIATLRKCLAVAEGRLRQTLDTPNSAVLAEIANIKKEGGIG